MDARAQAAVDYIIHMLEQGEAEVREELADKKRTEKDTFKTGWCSSITVSWGHSLANPKYNSPERNTFTYFFEGSDYHISGGHVFDEPTQTDLSFLTKDLFRQEMLPAMQRWLEPKVQSEPYGGLYADKFSIGFTLSTHRETRPEDPPHMQGTSWEQSSVMVNDEKRTEQFLQKVRDFIANEAYKTWNLDDISCSISRICCTAAETFLEEFGVDALKEMFRYLVEDSLDRKKHRFDILTSRIMDGFHNYTYKFNYRGSADKPFEPTENMLELCSFLGMQMLLYGTDKYERDYGRSALKGAGELGYKKAKEILKFGTGTLPMEVVQYKNKQVTCIANDIDKVVDFKIKEESEEAYKAMLEFLVKLMQEDFPNEYSIKFNSKVKEFLPIPGLKNTKASQFWNNCAQYPALFPLMKEYVRTVMTPFDYYSDASDEQSVPVGGYATFALGLADAANSDIVEEFMAQNDDEHSITPSYFIGAYIQKFGVTLQNLGTLLTCLLHANSHGLYSVGLEGGFTTPENLALLAEEMERQKIKGYMASILVDYIWGSHKTLLAETKKASGLTKLNLQKICALTEMEDED